MREKVDLLIWSTLTALALACVDHVTINRLDVHEYILFGFCAIVVLLCLVQCACIYAPTLTRKTKRKSIPGDKKKKPTQSIAKPDKAQQAQPDNVVQFPAIDEQLVLTGVKPDKGMLEIRSLFKAFCNQKLSGSIKPGEKPQQWGFGEVKAGFNIVTISFDPKNQPSKPHKDPFKGELLSTIRQRLIKIYGRKYPRYKPRVSIVKYDDGRDPCLTFNRPNREFVGADGALARFEEYRQQSKLSSTEIMFGYNDDEQFVHWNLAEMPHLLLLGGTGGGKGVIGHNILSQLTWANSPDDLQIIVVDPKQMELFEWEKTPHVVAPIALTVDDWFQSLSYVYEEMARRAELFRQAGVSKYDAYRARHKLPRLIFFYDEFSACQEDIEAEKPANEASKLISELHNKTSSIGKKSRALGIHLIIQSQDTLDKRFPRSLIQQLKGKIFCSMGVDAAQSAVTNTGRLNELLPTLNGKGDALFLHEELNDFIRFQSPSIYDTSKDLPPIINAINNKWSGYQKINVLENCSGSEYEKTYDRDYLEAVHKVAVENRVTQKLITDMGYERRAAEKLIKRMEEDGFISTSSGRGSSRRVEITPESVLRLIGDSDRLSVVNA